MISRMFTFSSYSNGRVMPTLREMSNPHLHTAYVAHPHVARRIHVLQQKAGIPYEVERQVCDTCARILGEKPVRRAAA